MAELSRAWQQEGKCATDEFAHIRESFFSDVALEQRRAKRICSYCPVRRECLAFALLNYEQFGVWGGRSELERRRMIPLLNAAQGSWDNLRHQLASYEARKTETSFSS